MKEFINILNKCELFKYMKDDEIFNAIKCLKGNVKKYKKNDVIFLAGDSINRFGIVLSGSILITKDDIVGNRNILTSISETGMFAETFILSNIKNIPVTVICDSNCEILFLEFSALTNVCECHCSFHNTLIQNMLSILANKNLLLNNKIEILSAKTTRDKLMAYFDMQISRTGKNKFKIPFNRDELADFLNLNRSSMSRELSKMRDEGILEYNKNEFKILI